MLIAGHCKWANQPGFHEHIRDKQWAFSHQDDALIVIPNHDYNHNIIGLFLLHLIDQLET